MKNCYSQSHKAAVHKSLHVTVVQTLWKSWALCRPHTVTISDARPMECEFPKQPGTQYA